VGYEKIILVCIIHHLHQFLFGWLLVCPEATGGGAASTTCGSQTRTSGSGASTTTSAEACS